MDKGAIELQKLLDKIRAMTSEEFMEYYNSGIERINFDKDIERTS